MINPLETHAGPICISTKQDPPETSRKTDRTEGEKDKSTVIVGDFHTPLIN